MSALGLALVGVGLTACGQKGSLYLPTDPLAKERATLPGLLLPAPPPTAVGDVPPKPPAAAASAPAGASQ